MNNNLKGIRLFFVLVLITLLLIMVFFVNIKPHHLTSLDAFLGNFYRGEYLSFINDKKEAVKYLTKASDKGVVEAYCDLGEIYEEDKDFKHASKNYFYGAMLGSQRCEFRILGYSHPDESVAFNVLKYTADKYNYPSANFMVGKRLLEGKGTSIDASLGVSYLEKGAHQNHWGSRLYLAGLYIKGELLEQDIEKANRLMDKSFKY